MAEVKAFIILKIIFHEVLGSKFRHDHLPCFTAFSELMLGLEGLS